MLNKWLQQKTKDGSGRKKTHRTFRPLLESLEHRLAPATFSVFNTSDPANPAPGDGSLREAIIQSNATAGPNQIVLNRRMDRPEVPQMVVEYVLFHEMLHVKHPTRRSGCTLLSHSPEFRSEEKRFAHFATARKFLDRLAR